MGTLKWYKRDPRAALIGMANMSLRDRGAYNTILDLIYIRDGNLKDDPAEICRWLKCKPDTWKKIRAKLIDLEKIYVHGGCLHNERADVEIDVALKLVKTGAESALKRWSVYNEIKGLQSPYPMQSTTTKKESLSAKIVPITKQTTEKEKK